MAAEEDEEDDDDEDEAVVLRIGDAIDSVDRVAATLDVGVWERGCLTGDVGAEEAAAEALLSVLVLEGGGRANWNIDCPFAGDCFVTCGEGSRSAAFCCVALFCCDRGCVSGGRTADCGSGIAFITFG